MGGWTYLFAEERAAQHEGQVGAVPFHHRAVEGVQGGHGVLPGLVSKRFFDAERKKEGRKEEARDRMRPKWNQDEDRSEGAAPLPEEP